MSILYSTCSTPRSMSQLSVSLFDEKASELDKLKKQAVIYMKKVNALKLEYMQWWDNKRSSFLTAIQSVQMVNPSMCPNKLNSISDYHKLMDMAVIYTRAGKLSLQNNGIMLMEAFISFWERFLDLRVQCDEEVFQPVTEYCASITLLLDPEVKVKIDKLAGEIASKCDPDFDLCHINDCKENLSIYKLGLNQRDLIGLIGFIPHLANIQRRMCYFVTKLAVEKE